MSRSLSFEVDWRPNHCAARRIHFTGGGMCRSRGVLPRYTRRILVNGKRQTRRSAAPSLKKTHTYTVDALRDMATAALVVAEVRRSMGLLVA